MKKIFLLLFVSSLFIGMNAFATNGMRMIGFGPVQTSMGGVSGATFLDSASLLTNPAGMSMLTGRFDFGASYFVPTVKLKANPPMGSGTELDSDRGPSPVPAMGLIIPVNDKINFGLGAYGIAGMGVDYKKDFFGSTLYSSYSQMRFAPGASYKINDMASVGVTVNVMYATMEFVAGDSHSGAANGEQYPHMGASAFGYGGTIGVAVKPIDILTIGIAYESTSRFQDFQFNTFSGKEKLEFNQPMNATLGISAAPIKGLIVGFDVEWIRWSETNGKDKPKYSSKQAGTMTWNLNWDDQFVYKVGVQYTVNPMINVRLGYNYGKMPVDKTRTFENAAFPAIAEVHYTIGLGLNFSEKFALNLGAMYSPEAKVSGTGTYMTAGGPAPITTESKMSQYSIDLGISYKF